MKIALLTTSFVPSLAANSVQVMKMANAFVRNGHDVTLYAARGPLDDDPYDFYGVERGFELVQAERPAGGKLGAARYAGRQIKTLWAQPKADLYYGRASRLLLALAATGKPLGYEAHVLPSAPIRRNVQRALFRLPNFWRLVCITDALREDYLRAFPELSPEQVIVAHDGADPIDLSSATLDPDWPARTGALQVGYVGGIYPGRGVETLVEVGRRLPDVDIQVVGGDAKTVAMWNAQQLPTNVHFHGHFPNAQLAGIYAKLDVLTAPYRNKVSVHGGGGDIRRWMSPLKVFEYMSTGRAILCSDVPVLREVLREGDNALLLPGDSVDAWVDAVKTMRDDAPLRRRLGQQAHDDFLAHYTWQERASAILQPRAQQ